MNRRLIEQSVENLCSKGCRAVWADIEALEKGRRLPETVGLTAAERRAVIHELRAIMAVYEGRCVTG